MIADSPILAKSMYALAGQMSEPSDQDVNKLLADWRQGDQKALARLIPIVYQELRRVASARLRI
jgi:hypothetical protein